MNQSVEDLVDVEAVGGGTVQIHKDMLDRIMKEDVDEEKPVTYELILKKYPTVDSLRFKNKQLSEYGNWQKDMIRIFTDSVLADVAALPEAEVYCTDHTFKLKNKGKGKLSADFLIKDTKQNQGYLHRLILNKVPASSVGMLIDAHMFLLEVALFGNTIDLEDENNPFKKFCNVTRQPKVWESTKELITKIKEMKETGEVEKV